MINTAAIECISSQERHSRGACHHCRVNRQAANIGTAPRVVWVQGQYWMVILFGWFNNFLFVVPKDSQRLFSKCGKMCFFGYAYNPFFL